MSEAKEHEEYVRSRWERLSPHPSNQEGRWLEILVEGKWKIFDSWLAAYAFTKEREEQMRQVEREIEWLKGKQAGQKYHTQQAINQGNSETAAKADERYCTITRILAREQAALAELKKGMRQ